MPGIRKRSSSPAEFVERWRSVNWDEPKKLSRCCGRSRAMHRAIETPPPPEELAARLETEMESSPAAETRAAGNPLLPAGLVCKLPISRRAGVDDENCPLLTE